MATITTKFSPGDTVFLMSDNKVTTGLIDSIDIHVAYIFDGQYVCPDKVTVKYNTDGEKNGIDESRVFATKEELIASL